ncbi:hypothetical protein C9374_003519 [Naegleria lovaniensis]|uniref:non-specific serine/threonine protein kinase n=1 Tax=Naegleria lovaniensis TaxID=51637 RepID=A0AA88KLC6_NAELO|nr:uncharacterized protein C9374_003519 [Naegleria lovaniensis]KAG2385704.1 hypothetical protein C9374_003519 [Naegleria lovaniensis]
MTTDISTNRTILYVQPSQHSYTSLPNCTLLSEPCSSISQALLKLSQLFKLKIVNSTSALIYLLEGNYVENSSACQTRHGILDSYDDLVVASYPYDFENNDRRIHIDCHHGELLTYLSARSILFENVTIARTKLFDDGRYVVLKVSEFKFERCEIDELMIQAPYYKKNYNVTFTQCNVTNSEFYNFLRTNFEQSTMNNILLTSNKNAMVSIRKCQIQNLNFKSVPQSINSVLDINYSQTFSIVNSQFVNSTFHITRFQTIEFNGVNFDGSTSIYQAYSGIATLTSVVSTNGNFYLESAGIDRVIFSKCEFSQPNELKNQVVTDNKPIIKISSTFYLQMSATFQNLQTPPLVTSLVNYVILSGCSFKNNKGSVMANFAGLLDSEISLRVCTFSNNNMEQGFGGAIHIAGAQRCTLEQCMFDGNTALHGGAMYLDSNYVFMESAAFLNNIATRNGGALYFKNRNSYQFSNLGSFYKNNTAFQGGALYIEPMEPLKNNAAFLRGFHSCSNNTALYSGGCIYSTMLDMNDNYDKYLSSNIGNTARSYGPFIGGPLSNVHFQMVIQYDSNDDRVNVTRILYPQQALAWKVYPGQVIPIIRIQQISNNGTEMLNYLQHPVKLEPRHVDSMIHSDSSTNNNELIGLSLSIFSNTSTKIEATLIIEKYYKLNVTIHILECPDGYKLTQPFSYGYVCLKNEIINSNDQLLKIVIPVAVISGVFLALILGLLLLVIIKVVRNIYLKLQMLKRKVKAEKSLESKIIDKKVIFSEIKTPLLINGSGDYTPLLRSKEKKNHPSLIIPIEDIEIVKKIGEGSNGTVYQGKWNNKDVALKTLKFDDHDMGEEFEKEAAMLSVVNHPSIVKLYGISLSGSRKYIVVEFLPKGSLDKLIYGCKMKIEFLTLAQKINILLGIAKGMAYLHSLKPPIIHRDLKPGNILIDEEYNGRVCDFGLSKIMGNSAAATKHIGTVFYMAREMVDDNPKYSPKIDVYSFGIIMWELFFEENPYMNDKSAKIHRFHSASSGENEYNILLHVLRGERPKIPFLTPQEEEIWLKEYVQPYQSEYSMSKLVQLTNEYIELMKKCWDSEAEKRPEFSEIVQVLKRVAKML